LRGLTLASASFSRLRDKLTEKNRQLEASLRQIEELTSKDYLTGVFNRRHFMSMIETVMQRSERSGRPFCLTMLDLDLFKNINDHYGHPVCDEVLKVVCGIASGALRGVDAIGRLGGEEFAVLLPETSLEAGFTTMERVRTAVNAYDRNTIAQGSSSAFPQASLAIFRTTPCKP
jgi:diguanylate cyclase